MARKIIGSLKINPGSAPTAEKGMMYYDSASDKIKISKDGSTFKNLFSEDDAGDNNVGSDCRALVMYKGTISWNISHGGSGSGTGYTYDFVPQGGLPEFTAANSSTNLVSSFSTTTNTISGTSTQILAWARQTIDPTTTIQWSASFNGGTNYTDITLGQVITIANQGTSAKLKAVITRTDVTKIDLISDLCYYYS